MVSTINATSASGIVTTADNSQTLALQTNSTTAVYVDSSQQIGIGTSSPVNNGAGYNTLTLNGTNSGILQIQANGSSAGQIFSRSSTNLYVTALNATVFETGGANERMRIDSSGNVGIGTSSPSYKLDVANSTGGAVGARIGNGTNNLFFFNGNSVGSTRSFIASDTSNNNSIAWDGANNLLQFFTNGSERMRITSSGYVTLTNQPCFQAYSSSNIASGNIWTGWTTSVNITSSFNATTGVFTAPVAGTYMFSYGALANGSSALEVFAYKNGAGIGSGTYIRVANGGNAGGASNTFYITLSASDTISLYVSQGPTNTNGNFNFFNGRLIQ